MNVINNRRWVIKRWIVYGVVWAVAALLINLHFSTGDYAAIDAQADTFPEAFLSEPMPSARELRLQDAPWAGENGEAVAPRDRAHFAAIRATILERIGEYDRASVRYQRETDEGVKRVQVWIYGKDGMQTTVEIEFRKSGGGVVRSGEEWRVSDVILNTR